MTDPVRVVLVDDHVLFRTGLEVVLGADPRVEVAGQAADGVAAVEVARAARPDIVILDLRLPGCSGLECCRRIRDELPDTQVLVLTASDAEDDLVAALRAGAGGYLVKDGDPAELMEAVLGLREGRSIVPPDLAARALTDLARFDRQAAAGPIGQLTPREREVLALVALGLRNREIAARLFIAENTAKNHVQRVLTKLGMSSRAEAAVFVVRAGLLSPS